MGPRAVGASCKLVWTTARFAAGTLSGCQKWTTPGARSAAAVLRRGAILPAMSAGNVARVVVVLAACIAAAGSATSSSNHSQSLSPSRSQSGPPPPQQMEATRALGLWRSTFGAVKIEPDASRGGLESGNVQGIWVYQRQGQEVVGCFAGNLRGNVLQFRWQEPNDPPLTGEGFLVFDQQVTGEVAD